MGLPIKRIVIDGHEIQSDQFALDGVEHDISEGTVIVTFVNVRNLEVVYTHMEDGV